MCFICKLSFGFTRSFVAHAIGEHGMKLIQKEKDILAKKNNVSAIIQGLGKDKEPLMSFLEPNADDDDGETNDRGCRYVIVVVVVVVVFDVVVVVVVIVVVVVKSNR